MFDSPDVLLRIAFAGAFATAMIDLWALLRRQLFAIAPPDYALVGRWLAGCAHGRFRNESMAAVPMVRGERIIGWAFHYAIGIAYAALPPLLCGDGWLLRPTPWPALLVGLGTAVAPLFVMQPGMGLGFAGNRTPNPGATRRRTLVTHAIFGLGLYAGATLAAALV